MAEIELTCESCKTRLRARAAFAGRTVHCPNCGAEVQVREQEHTQPGAAVPQAPAVPAGGSFVSSGDSDMTTEERFEKMESELRGVASELMRAKRWNRALLAGVCLAAGVCVLLWCSGGAMKTADAQAAGLGRQAGAAKIVRANQFILEDEKGKTRATLDVGKDGPGLWLSDENGKDRALLAVGKDGPVLSLLDEKGKYRARLTAPKDGPGLALSDENDKLRALLAVGKDGPGLALLDENDKLRALLTLLKDGPALDLRDENGKARARLTVLEDGPRLWLADENDKLCAGLSVGKDGTALGLFDKNGKMRCALGAGVTTQADGRKITYPESSLRLFGPDGFMIWQAPK